MNKGRELISAIMKRNMEKMKQLLKEGADINVRDEGGIAPLHKAAMCGNQDMIEPLLAYGAWIDVRDNWNYSPLSFAILGKHAPITRLLLTHGAYDFKDPKAKNACEWWMQDWKKHGLNDEEEIKCGITMLFAGVTIRDDILPSNLKVIKESMEQSLSPLGLSKAQIFSILGALPKIFDIAKQLNHITSLSMHLDHDNNTLKQHLQELRSKKIPDQLTLAILKQLVDSTVVKKLISLYQLESNLANDPYFDGKLRPN